MEKGRRYPDPLEISPQDPLDFRCVDGKWIYDPGWWQKITKRRERPSDKAAWRAGKKKG